MPRPFAAAHRSRRALSWETLEDRQLMAGDLEMIDINSHESALFQNSAVVGNRVVYLDTDPVHGAEPRLYNPLTKRATLLADVNPGPADSAAGNSDYYDTNERGFAVVGTKVFFTAYEPATGKELRWVDVADANRTVHTVELVPGPESSYPRRVTAAGAKVYFVGRDTAIDEELRWIDTGEPRSPVHTLDINPGGQYTYSSAGEWAGLNVIGKRLFFDAYDSTVGSELRWIDTTLKVPKLHTLDVGEGNDFSTAFSPIVVVGNQVLFKARDAKSGSELRLANLAAPKAPIRTIEISPGSRDGFMSSQPLVAVGTKVYFVRGGFYGDPLRWIDLAEAQPRIRKLDIAPGRYYAPPTYLTAVGKRLFFSAEEPQQGNELRWIDTTLAVPKLHTVSLTTGSVSSMNPYRQTSQVTAVGTKLYFMGKTPGTGWALRWIDTAKSMTKVHTLDVKPGFNDYLSQMPLLKAYGKRLYFSSQESGVQDFQLHWIDTTVATPKATRVPLTSTNGSSNPSQLTVIGSKMYFIAGDVDGNDPRLRWIEPSVSGTQVHTVDTDLDVYSLQLVGTKLFFTGGQSYSISGLYWIDTAAEPTVQKVKSVDGRSLVTLTLLMQAGDRLFFRLRSSETGNELGWIDTTLANPPLHVIDINTGPKDSSSENFTVAGDKLYFTAQTVAGGKELHWLDLTIAKPVPQTLDINPGSASSTAGLRGFELQGSKLYFMATDPDHGQELRWIDTTLAVPELHTIETYAGTAGNNMRSCQDVTSVGSKVFFPMGEGTYQGQLRWIDSSEVDPQVHTIPELLAESNLCGGFEAVGDKLFYNSTIYPSGNYVLAYLDTTEAEPQPHQLLDSVGNSGFSSGFHGSGVEAIVVGSTFFYRRDNPLGGYELSWLDASLPDPTINSLDINPGPDYSYPRDFMAFNNRLYFSAERIGFGRELFSLDLSAPSNGNALATLNDSALERVFASFDDYDGELL